MSNFNVRGGSPTILRVCLKCNFSVFKLLDGEVDPKTLGVPWWQLRPLPKYQHFHIKTITTSLSDNIVPDVWYTNRCVCLNYSCVYIIEVSGRPKGSIPLL